MNLKARLTMLCDITPVSGQDTAGDVTYGPQVNDIECYVFGNSRRFRNEKGEEYIPEFQLMLYPAIDINNNYKVDNIRDKYGTVVLDGTVVNNIQLYNHPRHGPVITTVYLSRR